MANVPLYQKYKNQVENLPRLELIDGDTYKTVMRHLKLLSRGEEIPRSEMWVNPSDNPNDTARSEDEHSEENRERFIQDSVREWRRLTTKDTNEDQAIKQTAIIRLYERRLQHHLSHPPPDMTRLEIRRAVLDGIFTAWDKFHKPIGTLPEDIQNGDRTQLHKKLQEAVKLEYGEAKAERAERRTAMNLPN